MSDARRARMVEARYLRDSARALVEADMRQLRGNLAQKGFAERAMDRVREGATDVYEEAIEVASDHKGALAAIVAALVVWFARHPIMSLFTSDHEFDEGGDSAER